MISDVDINDWDSKPAANGKGWEVQKLTRNGWVRFDKPTVDKQLAEQICEYWSGLWPSIEFRVYEVLG